MSGAKAQRVALRQADVQCRVQAPCWPFCLRTLPTEVLALHLSAKSFLWLMSVHSTYLSLFRLHPIGPGCPLSSK